MKETLEYKILKHLKENDNGEYVDMSKFTGDLKLLKIKLNSLSKKPEKYISSDLGSSIWFGDGDKIERNCILAKIEFKGIKYLNELENTEKSIVNNGILIQDSLLEKSPIKQKTVNKTEKKPSKKSWIEIASLVIGSIIGLIGIWEFIIKKLL
jgi:preprotein translocase subunit Sss1